MILSKLFRNGLQVFEHFHNLKLHYDDKDKVNALKNFMELFAKIPEE